MLLGTTEEMAKAGLLSRFAAHRDDDAQLVGARAQERKQVRQTSILRSLATAFERQVKVAIWALLTLTAVSAVILLIGCREPDGRRMSLADTWSRLQTDRARGIAVLTSNDLANIETGLAVRDLLDQRWAQVPVVLRLFDRRMTSTVRSSFDFHYIRSPAALAAP